MGFLKDFKDDLSQAVSELLPEKEVSNVDASDQMVNTLDLDDITNSAEAESQMKDWLDGFAQDKDNDETQDENDIYLGVEDNIHAEDNLKDDNIKDEDTLGESNIKNEDNLQEDSILGEYNILDEDIIQDEVSTMNDDTAMNGDINDNIKEEISYEMMEDGVELMGKNSNKNFDENVDENIDVDFDEMNEVDFADDNDDDNIDLELLDALNAEESADEEEVVAQPEKKLRAASLSDDDEVTVITKGTTIDGNISSDGSLDIMGNITGDVECLGKLSITGKIVGNSTAAEVYINTERLEGSVNSEGSVKVGLGTVIVGDIVATSGVIAGAVKGEIDINGPIVIDSTAIIKGNIKAKSVQINNGAVIEGFCSLSYSDIDVDNVFE